MEGCQELVWGEKGLARLFFGIAVADFYEAKRKLGRSPYLLGRLDTDARRDRVKTLMRKR